MAKALATGLASIPSIELDHAPEANILFCRMPSKMIEGLLAHGFRFYHDRWEQGVVRLVTSFATKQGRGERCYWILFFKYHASSSLILQWPLTILKTK
jgi:threonine aldolase